MEGGGEPCYRTTSTHRHKHKPGQIRVDGGTYPDGYIGKDLGRDERAARSDRCSCRDKKSFG